MHDSLTVETNAMKYLQTSHAAQPEAGELFWRNLHGRTGAFANRCIAKAARKVGDIQFNAPSPSLPFPPRDIDFAFILIPQIIMRSRCITSR